MNFRDVAIRAGKTFIQSFLGVFIPELCMVLSASVPDATFWTVTLPPLLCAALAASISAAWNIFSVASTPDITLASFERIPELVDFEFAASELNASNYSSEALTNYAVAVSNLLDVVVAEFNCVSALCPDSEFPAAMQ